MKGEGAMKRVITAEELMRAAEQYGFAELLSIMVRSCHMSLPIPQSMMEMSIEELNLSVRARNGLMRAKTDTVGRVVELIMSDRGLSSLRNIGRKTVAEIKLCIVSAAYERMDSEKRRAFWVRFVADNREFLPENI